ncbi:MAG: MarR family winged helix-turn-helix transcriptional regulator [Lacisediminihabitans sp.]
MSETSGLATEFASAEESPGLLLWQVTNRWQAAQRAALKPFDLTHVQFVLLASLAWLDRGAPVTQRQLAGHTATDPMMTSQVLRALEERGLVSRRNHPTDARAKALRITQDGRALANRANAHVENCDREFFGALTTRAPAFTTDLQTLKAASERARPWH